LEENDKQPSMCALFQASKPLKTSRTELFKSGLTGPHILFLENIRLAINQSD